MKIMDRKQGHRDGHQAFSIKERDLRNNQRDDLARKPKISRAEETAAKETEMQIMGEGKGDDACMYISPNNLWQNCTLVQQL